MAQFHLQWEAPEFEYREKTVSWYWITIIVAACLIAFAVWQQNYLFGFFIVVAEMLLILWGNKEPRMAKFSLTDSKITIEIERTDSEGEPTTPSERAHTLKEFANWSVEDFENGTVELEFSFVAKMKVPLKILAPEENLDTIRKHLKTVLPEVEHQITHIEAIERLLRF